MDSCNFQVMTRDEVTSLRCSERPEQREQAVTDFADLLTSQDAEARHNPLAGIVTFAAEPWAAFPGGRDGDSAGGTVSERVPRR